MGVRLKVCGITEPAEIDVLAAAVGRLRRPLVRRARRAGGPALEDWRGLAEAAAARAARPGARHVRSRTPTLLREALESAPVTWVQLHGYQTPGLVRAVKAIAPEIRVLKVLHVRGERVRRGVADRLLREGRRRRLPLRRGERRRPGREHRRVAGLRLRRIARRQGHAAVPPRGRHLGRQPRRATTPSRAIPSSSGSTSTRTPAATDGKVSAPNVHAISQAWRDRPAEAEHAV